VAERPSIPAEVRREVLVEAGHRCAIQQCRSAADVDLHHIVPWEECRTHDAANLIALCPNCHRLADRGKIDRKSLLQYKEICQKLTQPPRKHIERELSAELEVKAFIKFAPNQVTDIRDARNISSLTDNGVLDFTFSFIEDFEDAQYVVNAIGNGRVNFVVTAQTKGSIGIRFVPPCPNIVRLEFRY
jgi:hypothetical protein